MQTITKTTYRRRIRFYARKLAEIESFIEQANPATNNSPDCHIIIHKYWQKP